MSERKCKQCGGPMTINDYDCEVHYDGDSCAFYLKKEVERLKKRESVLVNVLLESGVIVNDGDEWICKLCDASADTRENIKHEDWCAFMEEGGR